MASIITEPGGLRGVGVGIVDGMVAVHAKSLVGGLCDCSIKTTSLLFGVEAEVTSFVEV